MAAAATARVNEYAELRKTARQRGLFDRQPVYYTIRIGFNLALLALSLVLLFRVESFALQLLNALLMAFAFVQIAFVAHNSGHREVGTVPWQDEVITYSHFGMLLGVSPSWWVDKHNEHHGHPNVEDMDPDIDFPMLAFTEEQAQEKRGIPRFIVKYQAFFFPLMISFITYNMRFHSVRKLLSGTAKRPRLEAVMMVVHLVIYFALLFTALPAWQAIIFAILHQAVTGSYLALTFAVNHKGMPVLPSDHELDFLRLQVLTSRNVRATPWTDFLYGGLNYQVEHHLFPNMPQNKLREAQRLTRDFCEARDIPYHETGFFRALWEVLEHLHHVSAPLRAPVVPRMGMGD